MANAGLGVPVKLLHESLGHVITVELKTGHLYRGKLAEGMIFFPSLTSQVLIRIRCSGGQSEHIAKGHNSDRKGWPCIAVGASVYQR